MWDSVRIVTRQGNWMSPRAGSRSSVAALDRDSTHTKSSLAPLANLDSPRPSGSKSHSDEAVADRTPPSSPSCPRAVHRDAQASIPIPVLRFPLGPIQPSLGTPCRSPESPHVWGLLFHPGHQPSMDREFSLEPPEQLPHSRPPARNS